MSSEVQIKGTRHGLMILIPQTGDFDELKDTLRRKMDSANGFFEGARFFLRPEQAAALSAGQQEELELMLAGYGLVPVPGVVQPPPRAASRPKAGVSARGAATTRQTVAEAAAGAKADQAASPTKPAGKPGLSVPASATTKPARPAAEAAPPKQKVTDTAAGTKADKAASPARPAGAGTDTVAAKTPLPDAAAVPAAPGDRTHIVWRTIRSGQQVRNDLGHLVIMGHVHSGALVEAGGHVLIMGSSSGTVRAGMYGDRQAKVAGLDFRGGLVAIADAVVFIGESESGPGPGPHQAVLQDEGIVFIPFPAK